MKIKMRWPQVILVALSTALTFSRCSLAAQGRFERTLNVTGPVELEVSAGSGDIQVRAGDASTVRVVGLIKTSDESSGGEGLEERIRTLESNPPIEQDGNRISIGRLEGQEVVGNLSISYELSVPVETRVRSESGSGDQVIEGIRGPVEARSGSGDFNISHVGNGVRVATGSGDVNIAETSSGDVEVSTGSGDVKMQGVLGALRVRTGSGDISVNGEPSAGWKLDASSGEVEIHVGGQAAFDLRARCNSGDIRTDIPITLEAATSRREVRGKVRGGGVLVEVSTASGNIHIF